MNFSTTADGRISREITARRKLNMPNLACLEKTWNPLINRTTKIMPNKSRDNLKMKKPETGSAKAGIASTIDTASFRKVFMRG
jgi:hypothetical protein